MISSRMLTGLQLGLLEITKKHIKCGMRTCYGHLRLFVLVVMSRATQPNLRHSRMSVHLHENFGLSAWGVHMTQQSSMSSQDPKLNPKAT